MQSIPSQILKDTVVITNPTGVDEWNEPTYETITQSKVHLQGVNKIVKNKENTEVQLKSILFVDKRLSKPFIDWSSLQLSCEATGHEMRVECNGHSYAVVEVDDVPDPYGQLHHYEVGLI